MLIAVTSTQPCISDAVCSVGTLASHCCLSQTVAYKKHIREPQNWRSQNVVNNANSFLLCFTCTFCSVEYGVRVGQCAVCDANANPTVVVRHVKYAGESFETVFVNENDAADIKDALAAARVVRTIVKQAHQQV
jgi:hypothetical protein